MKGVKKGSMSIVIIVWMIVMMCCTALLNAIIYSRYVENEHYSRQKNKYVANGSIELCAGLLTGYFNNLSDDGYYSFRYEKTSDDSNVLTFMYQNTDSEGETVTGSIEGEAVTHDANYQILSDNSPYIVPELKNAESDVAINMVNDSVNEYMASIGYFDFRSGDNNASLSFDSELAEEYNLYNLIRSTDSSWFTNTNAVYIDLPDIKAHVDVNYMGGHISSDLIISGLRLYRDKLTWIESGEGIVYAFIDTENMSLKYEDYKSIHV